MYYYVVAKKIVLVIDDEIELNNLIKESLVVGDIFVYQAYTIKEGLDYISKYKNIGLVILDRMLPDGDGIEFLKKIRGIGLQLPVIILSVDADENSILKGLELGATDYISKPFRVRELQLKINNMLMVNNKSEQYIYDKLFLDSKSRKVMVNKKYAFLTKKEYLFLELLVIANGEVVSKKNIYKHIWGSLEVVDFHRIDSLVYNVRSKIKNISKYEIKVVSNEGYYIE
jgi:DNA-binding response OmpR family regulator